jgi:mersacidin/lichenicidin family type 2 lantibiotic
MDVPDGIDVNVVENSDNTVHITMPAAPTGAAELSDEELSNAAGGTLLTDCNIGDICPADVSD